MMKRISGGGLTVFWSLIVLLAVVISGCDKEEKKEVFKTTIVPIQENAGLNFRGYVTDENDELVSKIYSFNRFFSHVDTVEGYLVYVFLSDDERSVFRIDEEGTIEQLMTVDLSKRLWTYDLRSERPVQFGYWETMFKTTQGVGTEWDVLVDTTVTMLDKDKQNPVPVRYYYHVKARFAGWAGTAIPESKQIKDVLDVNLLEIENFIVNEAARDSLFVKRGTGHYYFDPVLGMIKYTTDYHLKRRGEPYVVRHGTWELVDKSLPN